jgi:hypothetical protein
MMYKLALCSERGSEQAWKQLQEQLFVNYWIQSTLLVIYR